MMMIIIIIMIIMMIMIIMTTMAVVARKPRLTHCRCGQANQHINHFLSSMRYIQTIFKKGGKHSSCRPLGHTLQPNSTTARSEPLQTTAVTCDV